jgi:hypothetical protein
MIGSGQRLAIALASIAVTVAVLPQPAAAQPAIAGYANYAEYVQQIADLDSSDVIAIRSLGQTLGKRELYLLTIGTGDVDRKPAILVVGNVFAPHLVGSELPVRIARLLAAKSKSEEPIKKLLERYTIYVMPRPNPDGSEAFFHRPYVEREGNTRPTDDDRDGSVDEDPPDDLNGDGQITMIRVHDARGPYMPHPDDSRVLIQAEPAKNERGQFLLYTEGRDNDGDEQWNEDGHGGVSFDRNFTFKYPYFQPAAGPHPVSEIETRAVADFAFSRPNIAAVFCFSPQDNLMHPAKPNPQAESTRIKTTLLGADAPYMDFLADRYRTIHGGKDAPSSPAGNGSFPDWTYFHYGRWSLAARAWWVPKVEPKKPKEGEKKPAGEKRGEDDVNALRWLKREAIDGFVDWTPIEHPDFPGKKVEVGGFKPFIRLNPPAKELDALAEKHVAFLVDLAGRLPQLSIESPKIEPLGAGLFRVTATVSNTGYLPTMSEMGRVSDTAYPLQLKIEPPKGTKLLQGTERTRLERLSGNGGYQTYTWTLRRPDDAPPTATIRAYAPAVGEHSVPIELKQ